MASLLALISEREDRSGIIYCATCTAVEKVCQTLCQRGIAARVTTPV